MSPVSLRHTRSIFVLLLLLLGGSQLALAAVKLPQVISDHMILQRDIAVPIWGWADPGEKVTVAFAGQSKVATADLSGNWHVTLDAMPASAQPREMTITAGASGVKLADVLVGDVWVAGGQSNMGSPLNSAHNAAEALPRAQDDALRFFRVKMKTAAEPQTYCTGKWEASTPESAKSFSAVAYFFAEDLRRNQKIPIAVLQAPWGGTDIETWISLRGLQQSPPLQKTLDRWDSAVAEYQKIKADPNRAAEYERELKQWQKEIAPAYNAALKQYLTDKAAGKAVGPRPQPAKPEPNNPDPMGMPSPSRRPSTPTVNYNGMIAPLTPYAICGVIWYQGENNGGRGLEYRQLFPRLIEDWRKHWQYAAGAELPFLFVQLPACGADPTPVAQQGWPWLREAQLLALKLPRTGMAITIDVGDPNNVHPADKLDVGRRLALLARKMVYGENTVSSGPLYRNHNIESDGKVRVRFTEIGSGLTIGQQPWCAPGVEPFPKDKLIGFYIAGDDRQWVPADAKIDGDSVIVSSGQVPKPVAVRYGWANSPRCNLYNKEGLPASPFRTDDWDK